MISILKNARQTLPRPPRQLDAMPAPLAQTLIVHYKEVVDFLSLRTGCRDVARDCAQDAWLRLSGARPASAPVNLKAYVFRVAANIAMDWHRQRRREESALAQYGTLHGDASAPDTFDTVAAAATLRRLEQALLAQPVRSIEVFVAHKLDGHSYAETARLLGISVSAVEKHMMRILLACQAVLTA